ncbi:restriction endonuclease [Flavobacterium petrolei]|jgi:hypothetical protein|uniref:restriction endonuclease n=1 Tax=Flavobacterium petrolei TaxID=2259594 RepID=UPI003757865E
MSETPEWYNFQEDICNYFRSLGATAETNVSIQGVRTTHDIDILVKTKFLGHDILWIVEAKKWKSKVNKLQVLGLRTIVEDVGADRGFIISENGFQSGAIDSAKNTNVQLTTYENFKQVTKESIQSGVIQVYKDRLILLETRYWSHSKKIRRKYSLRGEIWDYPVDFSGHSLMLTAQMAISSAMDNEYPIDLETHSAEKRGNLIANNFQELTNWLNLNLNFLDEKILKAEIEMIKNGDFNPELFSRAENELPINLIANKISATIKSPKKLK